MKITIASPLSDFDSLLQALTDGGDDTWQTDFWFTRSGDYADFERPQSSQITVQTVEDPARIQLKVDGKLGVDSRFITLSIPTRDARRIAEAILGVVNGMEGTDGGEP